MSITHHSPSLSGISPHSTEPHLHHSLRVPLPVRLLGIARQICNPTVEDLDTEDADLLSLEGQAISDINALLEGAINGEGTDNLLSAVSVMAAYEALRGDHCKYRIHMGAVERLVKLRGGCGG